jgi:hypothetical protein
MGTPQYRMLTYGLQKAKGVETYTFDNVTAKQKKKYAVEYAKILALRDKYLASESTGKVTGKRKGVANPRVAGKVPRKK